MNYKLKMVILAAVLLFGVTGVALASGKLPGAVSDGLSSLKGSDSQGTGTVGSASGEQYGEEQEMDDSAAGNQYGEDDATEIEKDRSAADDEYGDDAGEIDKHDSATGNNGQGLEHENEHGNVPATTPAMGGNSPMHGDDEESHQSAQGGSGTTTSHRNDTGSGLSSGSGSGVNRHTSTPPMEERD